MNEANALEALAASSKAWDNGSGVWPQMPIQERMKVIERISKALRERREQLADVLMWEICKTKKDSLAEIDRTLSYIDQTLTELQKMEDTDFETVKTVLVRNRRRPIGVCVVLGPMNYPFNETYCMLIPALLMGNTAVMKVPRVGGLVHHLTCDVFARELPAGVLNFITGSARATIPAVMKTGDVDVLGFIGGSSAANSVIQGHPSPHRLINVLGLDAKNVGLVCASADLDLAATQCALGAFSFNGQRCTAIKMIYVHETIVDSFVSKFTEKVEALEVGLPWDNPRITPISSAKANYINELADDAMTKGAKIINKRPEAKEDSPLFHPIVVYPTTTDMRVCQEEQFGPICPVASFAAHHEVVDYIKRSKYGQQVAIFSKDAREIGSLVDQLVHQVARVNVNSQCSRGPDTLPFTGRKSSALRTLSVRDALLTFSMESLTVTPLVNSELLQDAASSSSFLGGKLAFHAKKKPRAA